ncbi:NmrA family NAD(P)-binding protein [Pendulispora rubella]|uniref:NmrA family NAD(P)-binding protein n=1 Tax=Pendulispora rubella TaxID=2741070 RepID=A0ABZ2LAF4_9BACT
MSQPVLITGATGHTGRQTLQILAEKRVPVRALVHQEDARAQQLRALGAEVVVGDLLDFDDARRALRGVRAAYFVFPIRPGVIQSAAYFGQAAKEAGVEAIVNMSQISARKDAKSHAAQDHWVAERVLDDSGVPTIHIRPTYFAEWLVYPHFLATIRDEGAIRHPFGQGRHAPIAAEDQARLIAAFLVEPEPHLGKIYPLHGPVEMSQHEIAAAVGKTLGKKVVYEPSTMEEYRALLERAKMSPFLVQHLCEVAVDYQNGIFAGEDSIIEAVTGQAPMTVQAYLSAHRSAYVGGQ